jgi:hypothetical protein
MAFGDVINLGSTPPGGEGRGESLEACPPTGKSLCPGFAGPHRLGRGGISEKVLLLCRLSWQVWLDVGQLALFSHRNKSFSAPVVVFLVWIFFSDKGF